MAKAAVWTKAQSLVLFNSTTVTIAIKIHKNTAFTCPAKHHQQPVFIYAMFKPQNPHSYLSILVKCGRVLTLSLTSFLGSMGILGQKGSQI